MARGPVPKRDEARRRRNKPEKSTDTVEAQGRVKAPPANAHWHALAKRFYAGLKTSAQAKFYEPSDWQVAHVTMELLSNELRATKPSASMVAVIFQQLNGLGATEGDRRRMRIEIEREPPAEEDIPDAADIDEARRRLRACQ
jgi:hypothetical protein